MITKQLTKRSTAEAKRTKAKRSNNTKRRRRKRSNLLIQSCVVEAVSQAQEKTNTTNTQKQTPQTKTKPLDE